MPRGSTQTAVVALAVEQTPASSAANHTLTAVPGIKVGHHTLSERPTGCTVILVDGDGAAGGVSQRGGAPGTRETDLLDPANMVDKVNAVVLSGGSAFGLEAATGTVRWLEEHNIGWDVRIAKVPIVPAAILFDLPVGGNPKIRPTADCGYQAAAAHAGLLGAGVPRPFAPGAEGSLLAEGAGAIVLARPEAIANRRIYGWLEGIDSHPAGLDGELGSAVARRLNPLFKVHDVVLVDALPRTASHKLMRRTLRAGYTAG